MKISSNTTEEQTFSLRRAPGEGEAKRVTPLGKGLSHSDWGLRQMDFTEILNDSSTNPLALSIINSSN